MHSSAGTPERGSKTFSPPRLKSGVRLFFIYNNVSFRLLDGRDAPTFSIGTLLKFIEIALIAVALGCDAFAVGMGVGTKVCGPRPVFRLSFHFGLFQFIMPLLGWYLGQNMVGVASKWAPWIAFALLFLIGAKMIWDFFNEKSESGEQCIDPTRGLSLVVLSLATSIDALGVGFSLGILGAGLLFPAAWIGLTAAAMTWGAMMLGHHLSSRLGKVMEFAGGVILIIIAIKLLL